VGGFCRGKRHDQEVKRDEGADQLRGHAVRKRAVEIEGEKRTDAQYGNWRSQMTLIKSLLLGSAAGIVAVATAQAADLPTRKAAPVEYVRVCNVGGITGWTLPGSDTCVKFSGYMTAHFIGGNISNQYNSASAQTAGGALYPGLATALGDPNGAHLSQLIMVQGGDSQTTAAPGTPFSGPAPLTVFNGTGVPITIPGIGIGAPATIVPA